MPVLTSCGAVAALLSSGIIYISRPPPQTFFNGPLGLTAPKSTTPRIIPRPSAGFRVQLLCLEARTHSTEAKIVTATVAGVTQRHKRRPKDGSMSINIRRRRSSSDVTSAISLVELNRDYCAAAVNGLRPRSIF